MGLKNAWTKFSKKEQKEQDKQENKEGILLDRKIDFFIYWYKDNMD